MKRAERFNLQNYEKRQVIFMTDFIILFYSHYPTIQLNKCRLTDCIWQALKPSIDIMSQCVYSVRLCTYTGNVVR